jgi:hypothetical protein
MTGSGELSRKILAILMTTVMLSSGAFANDVYVEQIGDNSQYRSHKQVLATWSTATLAAQAMWMTWH